MAARAASLISGAAGKAGKPWARLTASYCSARRVISRMTDSVKCSTLAESMRRAPCATACAADGACGELNIGLILGVLIFVCSAGVRSAPAALVRNQVAGQQAGTLMAAALLRTQRRRPGRGKSGG